MRDKFIFISLIASVFIGIVAVVFATFWLRSYEASKITKVVIASQNISSGDVLSADNLRLSDWIGPNIPSGANRELSPLFTRVAKADIFEGDVLRETSLIPLVSDGSLAAAISPGKRAVSIRVSEEGGVAGFVLPGNYVDILFSTKENISKPVSKILFEKILVLAIAQERSKPNRSEPKVVNVITLEMSVEQAEQIDLARLNGNLSLVLRNQTDHSEIKVPPPALTASSTPSPIEQPVVLHKQPVSRGTIEIIRGTSRQTN